MGRDYWVYFFSTKSNWAKHESFDQFTRYEFVRQLVDVMYKLIAQHKKIGQRNFQHYEFELARFEATITELQCIGHEVGFDVTVYYNQCNMTIAFDYGARELHQQETNEVYNSFDNWKDVGYRMTNEID